MKTSALDTIRAAATEYGWATETGPGDVLLFNRDGVTITTEWTRRDTLKYADLREGTTMRGFAFRMERDKRDIVLRWIADKTA